MLDSETSSSNLIAGTISKYALQITNIATGFFLMPFTVHHLGHSEYGLWMLVASLTYYFQLLDMGYGNGVVRHIIDADRRGRVDEVNEIVSTFLWIYGAIGAAALVIVGAMIAWVIPRFPNLTPDQVRTAQVLLAILGARVAIGFPMTVFGAVTNARQAFVPNNLITIGTVLISAVVTYVVLESGHGLLMLVACTTTVNMLGYVGYTWTAYRVFPGLKVGPRLFSRTLWRDVTAFSIYLFIIQIAVQVSFNIDNIVVGAFLGTAAVAVYTVGLRLSEYQRRLCDQFSGMMFPVVMAFGTDGNTAALRQTLIEGSRVGFMLVAGATVCLVGFGGPLIEHWMGPGFEGSVAPFIVLAIASVLIVSEAAVSNVLIAVGRHRFLAWAWLGEAAVNLVLSVLLVRRFGLLGVAVGTLVPLVIGHVFVLMPSACRAVALPVRRWIGLTLQPAIVGTFVSVLAVVAFRTLLPPESTRAVLGEGVLVGLLYLATVLTFGLTTEIRRQYLVEVRAAWTAFRRWLAPLPPASAQL